MCGIAGIIGLKELDLANKSIRLMTDRLKHRGPDATGVFVNEDVALGHLRLSIIDLSDAANQPFFDSTNRYAIVFNGEIYNFQEVRDRLEEYPFRTDSDTEVILAAYQKYGAECLTMLNGMFAFAIWDKERRELFAARDRLGVKPFYYARTPDGTIIFASEIRALLDSELVPRKLNNNGVYEYLTYQSVYSPETIVEGIYQLPAGEYGIFSTQSVEIRPYWKIEERREAIIEDTESDIKKNIKELLLKSVERRMISDVRLGAFLSGGIDSSAVVALMSEVTTQPVDTFSITFREKEFDESFYSRLVAQKFKTRHTEVTLSADDFLRELPAALQSADSPSGDGINTYVVSKATKNAGITVALSGLGGDELFAGYPNFLKFYKTRKSLLQKIPSFIRRPAGAVLAGSGNSKYQRIGDVISADKINIAGIYPMFRQVMSQHTARGFFDHERRDFSIRRILVQKSSALDEFPLLSQFSIAELLGYTQNVLLKDADQFSMASALEVREPFFDYKLVEYVLRIPDRIKYPKYPKSLLVESIYPLLPEEIVHRPKMGFVLPFDRWMRIELKDFCERRLKNLAARNILNADLIIKKWDDFQNRKNGVLWSHLWHLVVLAEWLENNKF